MKQQAIQYLFIDVHQATCVGTVRDAGGGIVMPATVATEARAILQLVRSAGPRVHVGFEEGAQAQWLHDLLVTHAEKVIVCNLRGRSESGNKSDRLDADAGSEQLRIGALRVRHYKEEVQRRVGRPRSTPTRSTRCGSDCRQRRYSAARDGV